MKKVLIVDDDKDLRLSLGKMLSKKGYETLAIGNGSSAVSLSKVFHPDIILLDVHLKDIDGREVCNQLRHDAKTSMIPIMMISADTRRSEISNVCDPNDFMEKPFNVKALYSKIEALTV